MRRFKKLLDHVREYIANEEGAVIVYSAFLSMMLLGATALVVDYGRSAIVRQELQNYADTAAQAGAAYLDGTPEAIDRATGVVNNTIRKQSSIADGAPTLRVERLAFYSSLSPRVTAISGVDAKFLEVVVASEQVTHFFSPFISMLSGSKADESTTMNARAAASGNPIACHVPPLMICDYSETMGPDYDLRSPANYGKQVKLGKASGMNTMAPGNFGVLDTADGSQATQDIAAAMAAVEPPGCYGSDGIDTAPGARVDAIRDGINARFDMPAPPQHFADPAPNVINYPRDDNADSSPVGSGSWDVESYWNEKHPGTDIPHDLPPHPSRYQVYLYELGEPFAYSGKKTIYPADQANLPAGYAYLTPAESPGIPATENDGGKKKDKKSDGGSGCDSSDPNCDGVPENNPPVEDPRRRVVEAVLLNCVSDNVKGNGGPYPSHGKYVELFITENVGEDHTIYGEVVRRLTPTNSSKLHSNVALNE